MTPFTFAPRQRAGLCRRVMALALAAVASLGGGPLWAQAVRNGVQSGDFIVAVVNTEAVTAVELAQRIERAQVDAKRANSALPDADGLRQQVLDALIDERVQITYARESGTKVDETEIDRAIANIASQNQISVAQLRDRLRSEGLDFGRFRNNLRDQLMVERVREREVVARIRVTDADIDRVLDERRSTSASADQINLAQILVTVPEGAAPDVLAERQQRIEQAATRLQAGESFSQVARDLSEDGNRAAGGEMGMRPVERFPDLFIEAVKGLAVGDATPTPLRSAAGYHLLKVIDRSDSDPYKVTQTRARHILLRLSERAQAAAVVRRMDGIAQQIQRGEKAFEAVAQEISEDGSAQSGGDLGWASPGQFVPEFEDAINKVALGSLSPPVVSRFGVHLIQVMERRSVSVDPKEVREQARNQLRETKFEPTYVEWAKELRLRAYIELREPPL
jgi:peptidyl-prolyl cis-trans isomerase SurA